MRTSSGVARSTVKKRIAPPANGMATSAASRAKPAKLMAVIGAALVLPRCMARSTIPEAMLPSAAISRRSPATALARNPIPQASSRIKPSTIPTMPAATRKPEDFGFGGTGWDHCGAYCWGG